MEYGLGIDIGTTFSAAAISTPDGTESIAKAGVAGLLQQREQVLDLLR